MKKCKKLFLLLVSLILTMGVGGCMKHNEYSEKILGDLNQKYNKNFEITKLSYEVNGDKGNYYRAICNEKNSEQSFVTYYYLNGSDLVDEYTNLLVSQALNEYYCQKDKNVIFSVTDVGAFDYTYTLEDVKKGVEHCVANDKFDTQIQSFIFVDSSVTNKSAFEESFVNAILSLNVYKLSINFIYISEADAQAVKSDYQDDIFKIEENAEEDIRVTKYCWYFAERGKGIVNQDTVKEV